MILGLLAAGCREVAPPTAPRPEPSSPTRPDDSAPTNSEPPAADAIPSGGCGSPPRLDDQGVQTLGDRTFELAIPDGYDADRPQGLILDLHGTGGTAGVQRALSGMGPAAGDRGYVVAWPESGGSGPLKAFDLGCDSPDARYLAALVDHLGEALCLDLARVRATGLSNGGYAANLAAGALGDRIRAVAPVAGGLGFMPFACPADRAMPAFVITSVDDAMFPVAEGRLARDWWFERNGCAGYGPADVDGCRDARGCEAPLRYCELDGVGHVSYYRRWPTTDAILAFFGP